MVDLKYDPERDIPDLKGKVIFITGGTSGIGLQSIIHLSKHNPSQIFFSGRNAQSASSLIQKVKFTTPTANITFIRCDLASLTSVKEAAESLLQQTDRLDILMNNAGVMTMPPGLTEDGYETHFGTNYLGHVLLTKLLLPLLSRTASSSPTSDVRIINLTSQAYDLAPKNGIDFPALKTPQDIFILGKWTRYGQSKLANLLYSRTLSDQLSKSGILVLAIHPGVVETEGVDAFSFVNKWLVRLTNWNSILTPEQGAFNQVWAATADREGMQSGGYYEPVGLFKDTVGKGKDDELAQTLDAWAEKELADYL